MELSQTIAAMAVVLGVLVSAGFAAGEEKQVKPDPREAQRRVLVEEQQKRREHFERACNRPLKTENDRQMCRAAYRAL